MILGKESSVNIEFEEYKETLPKEPSESNVKKEYYVGCHSADDWIYVHQILTEDGTLEDNIPKCSCECVNDCLHSPTRGLYLLTDEEVSKLRDHPRVRYVNINTAKYPGTYLIDPYTISDSVYVDRYSAPVKHGRNFTYPTFLPSTPGEDLKNRCGFQLLRSMQLEDPWIGDSNQIIESKVQQLGTGEDVDVIVADQDMWFGHIEFQNNLGGPQNYVGGNVLPGNGTCDLLDLVLDSPYYLDPDFFNADAGNRLTTRWDGTIVPVELYARNWWKNNNLSSRSSKFVSPGNGGTATGTDDFGTVYVTDLYTRERCNGSNTALHTGSGFHGTPCASQAYGRQYGWAYNANKWFLNMYGSGNNGFESGFDLQKVFHQVKPINPKYGTKDPTISSNSWGYRFSLPSSGYYYFRTGTDGSGGVAANFNATGLGQPYFMSNFRQSAIRQEFTPSSMITAGDELIDSGVIFICSAGNTNQKLVKADHPDYDNYYSTSNNTPLESSLFGSPPFQSYGTVNRQGFPGQIGSSGIGANREYKTIAIGALEDSFLSLTTYTANGEQDLNKEIKAIYSNMGNLVDCFAPADETLSAGDQKNPTYLSYYDRNDEYYTIDGQQSIRSLDTVFNGTSSACPVACGLIATKLQYNRGWTYADVKNWISGLGLVSDDNFYYGWGDLDNANSLNWADKYNLHGSTGYVIWDKPTGNEPTQFSLDSVKFASGNGLVFSGVIIKYS